MKVKSEGKFRKGKGTSCIHCGDEKKETFNTNRYSTRHKRMKLHFESMTDEELTALTLEKAPNGCASELAIEAQKYLRRRKELLGY